MAHGFSCCNVNAFYQHEKSCKNYTDNPLRLRIKELEASMQSLGAESTAVRLDNARLREALGEALKELRYARFDKGNTSFSAIIAKLEALESETK